MGFGPIPAKNEQSSPMQRHGLSALLVPVFLLAMFGAPRASGQGFRMTALNVPGSTGESSPTGINTSGEVSGTFTPKGDPYLKGFIYSGGKYTILSGPAGTDGRVRALGINSATKTVVVGDYLAGDRYHGYTYMVESGKYTTFDYNDTDSSAIFGINDNGDFAGTFGHAGAAQEGFLVTKGGAPVPFYGNGTANTYVYAINNSDDVVGDYYDSKGLSHGFLRAASGKITTIDYPGAAQTYLYGINASGEIAGTCITSRGADYGFTYAKGTFTVRDFATVNGLNAAGAFVGTYFGVDGAATGYMAVPQTFALSRVAIPASYGQYWSIIYAVNNAGVMVGGWNDASGNTHGLMISDGRASTIDDPDGVQTVLLGVNSANQIVGSAYDTQGNPHGFLYEDGKFTSIPGPSDALYSNATGINEAGWIAGDYYASTDKTFHAFILEGKSYKLLTVAGSYGTYTGGINNAGTVVVSWVDADAQVRSSIYDGSAYVPIDVPGAAQNIAWSITTAGDIVYRILDWNGNEHAAMKKGNDYYVFDYPGGVNSGALGINDHGKIAGFYSLPAKPNVQLLFEGTE